MLCCHFRHELERSVRRPLFRGHSGMALGKSLLPVSCSLRWNVIGEVMGMLSSSPRAIDVDEIVVELVEASEM